MLIQVIYPDGNHDYVKDFMLDKMVETTQIVKFRRKNGWVTLGVDPVRSAGRPRRALLRSDRRSVKIISDI